MTSDTCIRSETDELATCGHLKAAIGGPMSRVASRVVGGKRAIVLRAGEYQYRGVVLNFCPFCGERIFGHETTPSPSPN